MLVGTGKASASTEMGRLQAGVGTAGRVVTMQLLDGELVLSATDLTGFSACAHLTQLDLRVARNEIARAKRDDPFLDVLSRRGGEHEKALLAAFHADPAKSVIEIEYPDSARVALEGRPGADARSDAQGRRRDLSGHLLRRSVARPC